MAPHRLHLNLTGRCNLRCLHCYRGEPSSAGPSLALVEAILQKFQRFLYARGEKPTSLTLGGGEPTCLATLEQIVALATRRGFQVRLVTNGTNLDLPRVLQLQQAGLSLVQVSVQGSRSQTHEKICGEGTWSRMLRGVRALRAAEIFTVLSLVLLPQQNLDEAPHLLDLARLFDLAGVKFARPVLAGRLDQLQLPTSGDFWSIYGRILERARQIHYKGLLLFFDPIAHRLPLVYGPLLRQLPGVMTDLCRCQETELVEIDVCSGDISYCRVQQRLGNIWRDDLSQIWQNHPLLQAIRQRSPHGACRSCPAWTRCLGGCPALTEPGCQHNLPSR